MGELKLTRATSRAISIEPALKSQRQKTEEANYNTHKSALVGFCSCLVMILICEFPDPHLAVYSPIGLFLSYRLLDTESAHCQVAVVFGICRNAVLHCNINYVDAIGGCDDNLRSTDITYRFISVKWKTKILMYDLETTPKPNLKVVKM